MSVKRYNVYLDGSVVDNDQPVIHTQQEDDGRYVLHSDYAALEARRTGLERELEQQSPYRIRLYNDLLGSQAMLEEVLKERDALKVENERLDKESDEYLKQRDESESDIGRIAAAIGQDLSSAYGVPHLIDDIEELDASHDRLTKERDALQATLAAHESHGPEGHNVTNAQFVEVRDKLAAAEEALRRISKAIILNPILTQAHAEAVLLAVKEKADAILAGHAPATVVTETLLAGAFMEGFSNSSEDFNSQHPDAVACARGYAKHYAKSEIERKTDHTALPRTAQAAPSDREKRLEDALRELVEVATLRGDNDLPHPSDDPLLWTGRMQDAWIDAEAALADTTNNDGG